LSASVEAAKQRGVVVQMDACNDEDEVAPQYIEGQDSFFGRFRLDFGHTFPDYTIPAESLLKTF
jgi:hypothetical protein